MHPPLILDRVSPTPEPERTRFASFARSGSDRQLDHTSLEVACVKLYCGSGMEYIFLCCWSKQTFENCFETVSINGNAREVRPFDDLPGGTDRIFCRVGVHGESITEIFEFMNNHDLSRQKHCKLQRTQKA